MMTSEDIVKAYKILASVDPDTNWDSVQHIIKDKHPNDYLKYIVCLQYLIHTLKTYASISQLQFSEAAKAPINSAITQLIEEWIDANRNEIKKFEKGLKLDGRSPKRKPSKGIPKKNNQKDHNSKTKKYFSDLNMKEIEFLSSRIPLTDLPTKVKSKLTQAGFVRLGELLCLPEDALTKISSIGRSTVKEMSNFFEMHGYKHLKLYDWPDDTKLRQFLSDQDISDEEYFKIKIKGKATIEDELAFVLTNLLTKDQADILADRYGLNEHFLSYTFEELATSSHFESPVSRQRVQQIVKTLEIKIAEKVFQSERIVSAIESLNALPLITISEANEALQSSGLTQSENGFEILMIANRLGICKTELSTHYDGFLNKTFLVNNAFNKDILLELRALDRSLRGNIFVSSKDHMFQTKMNELRFLKNTHVIDCDLITRIPSTSSLRGNILFNHLAKLFRVFSCLNIQDILYSIERSRQITIPVSEVLLRQFIAGVSWLHVKGGNVVAHNRVVGNHYETEPELLLIDTFRKFGDILDATTLQQELLHFGKSSGTISQFLMFNIFLRQLSKGRRYEPATYKLIGDISHLHEAHENFFEKQDVSITVPTTIFTKTIGEFSMETKSIPDGKYEVVFDEELSLQQIQVIGNKLTNLRNIARRSERSSFELIFNADSKIFELIL